MIVTEVTDEGAGGARPYLRDEPLGVHGRGMRIIKALSLAWGIRPDGDRTTIWMPEEERQQRINGVSDPDETWWDRLSDRVRR